MKLYANRNEIRNLSYTKLGFAEIYDEVISLIKELSTEYDPSISNESDPGIIYTKLGALLADKLSYSIDKSALESFPASVTQMSSARQLFDSLGYNMHYVKAATCPVSITYAGETVPDTTYTIPKFIVLTNDSSTVTYSLIGVMGEDGLVVSDGLMHCNKNAVLKMIAMEGVATQYTFNKETTITPIMVDTDNRLYFESANVAENGVFINNVGQLNYASWHRVDNLYEQSYNELRYKFGYDSAVNLNYIELPDNYAELMGSGIEIHYIITVDGQGDIPANTLSQFLSPITPKENTSVTLDSHNVTIANYSRSSGHQDIETIDEAYKGYQRTVGTYKTLITLRDYLNYILNMEDTTYSNGFVTDRTDDYRLFIELLVRREVLIPIQPRLNKSVLLMLVLWNLRKLQTTQLLLVSHISYMISLLHISKK